MLLTKVPKNLLLIINYQLVEAQWGSLFPSKLGSARFESHKQCCKLLLAHLFLSCTIKHRFGTLFEELCKQYQAKTDNYPKLFEATKNWLVNYQTNHLCGGQFGDRTKHSFEATFHIRGGTSAWVQFYQCQEHGHVK